MLIAAAALVGGLEVTEAAKRAGIGRTTLWRWKEEDPPSEDALEFRRILGDLHHRMAMEVADDVVVKAVEDLRALAPQAIQAFQDGLAADVRYTKAKVTRVFRGEDGEPAGVEETYIPLPLPDRSLAVRTADLVTKRIAELIPRSGSDVHISGSIEQVIADLDAGGSPD